MLRQLGFIVCLISISACSVFSSPIPLPSETPEPIVLVVTATATNTPPATQTPVPTATSVRPPATAYLPPCNVRTDWVLYTVSSGDTLSRIAQRVSGTVNDLVAANCLSNANNISVGQQLRVPRLPVTATPVPPTPFPELPVYFSDGNPPYDRCIVILAANRTPQTTPLFSGANSNQPLNVNMGNWGLYMSSINGFHQMLMYPAGQVRNVFVRASDTTVTGSGCSGPESVTITQGDIQISPHMASQSRSFDLKAGDVVTLTWATAPGGLLNARFYMQEMNGSRTLLGSDAVESDGWSIQWSVPYNLTGQVLQAEGSAVNSAAFDIANTYPVSVYSNSDANWLCVALSMGPLPIYERPDPASAVVGNLAMGTQWMVTTYSADANTDNDWIGVRGGGGWVSASMQVNLTGSCPF